MPTEYTLHLGPRTETTTDPEVAEGYARTGCRVTARTTGVTA